MKTPTIKNVQLSLPIAYASALQSTAKEGTPTQIREMITALAGMLKSKGKAPEVELLAGPGKLERALDPAKKYGLLMTSTVAPGFLQLFPANMEEAKSYQPTKSDLIRFAGASRLVLTATTSPTRNALLLTYHE